MIFLTGTMINSSVGEVPDILNILSDEKKWIERTDYCEQKVILGDVPIWVFKKNGDINSMKYLKDRFLYYDQRVGKDGSNKIEKIKPIGIGLASRSDLKGCTAQMEKLMNNCVFANDELIAFRYAKVDRLPREHHIGNIIISPNTSEQPLLVYGVKLRGYQAQVYDSSMSKNEDDDSEMSISIHDGYIPPVNKQGEAGIYKTDNVYKGDFLGLDTVWKYSAIGYEMTCLCLMNSFNDEKTVVYHNKLNSFGIKQYAEILHQNGFIVYGGQRVKDSICKSCRRPYYMHGYELEDRLKNKVCNEFKGIFYAYLTGDLDTSERISILHDVYNNPRNTTGDILSVLFISDVAYAGVNLYSTNNIIILSKISNISKWKQIYNRVIRDNSHALLDESKHYVKVYTMVVIPGDGKDSGKLKGGVIDDVVDCSGDRCSSDSKVSSKCSSSDYKVGSKCSSDYNISNRYSDDYNISGDHNTSNHNISNHNTKQELDIEHIYGIKGGASDPPEVKYYKKNIVLNTDIMKYTKSLADESVSNLLFNHPEKMRFPISSSLITMFSHDIESEFNNIVSRMSPTYIASEWRMDVYIERIKDPNVSLSFINFKLFADKFIRKLIQRSKRIYIFKHTGDTLYIRVEHKKELSLYQTHNTISYNQLKQLENKRSTLNSLLNSLKREVSLIKKSLIMFNICRIFSGKFKDLKDVNLFWETIYEMGDEYYEDDEKNFFFNHSKKNRSPAKMIGFYYGNHIVIRDTGEMNRIPIKYVSFEGIPKYPYVFRIVSIPDRGIFGENSPFYLHVKLMQKTVGEILDRRKQITGVNCFSMNVDELKEYFPRIKISAEVGYRRLYCRELMFALCEEQVSEKNRFVYSPFEHA